MENADFRKTADRLVVAMRSAERAPLQEIAHDLEQEFRHRFTEAPLLVQKMLQGTGADESTQAAFTLGQVKAALEIASIAVPKGTANAEVVAVIQARRNSLPAHMQSLPSFGGFSTGPSSFD